MFERARLRLAFWYAAAFSAILIALGIATYIVMARELDDEVDDSLNSSIEELARNPRPFLGTFTPDRRHDEQPAEPLSADVFFFVIGPSGELVSSDRELDVSAFPVADLKLGPDDTQLWKDFEAGGERYRVTAIPGTSPAGGSFTLVAGRSLEARDYQLRLLAVVLGFGGLAGVALATVGGFLLAGRALVPIRRTVEAQHRFVSDASHELRTPIAVMKANAEVLLRHPDQTIGSNIDHLEAIDEESTHLARLVGDLLTLARADEHRLDLSLERFSLEEVLDGVRRDMEAVATARHIELSADLRPGEITADAQRVRQLTAILLDNALKFTPSGGRVNLASSRQGSRWSISVSDTGPGIPVEAKERIFDRFYRADESRSASGTGLGLAIARTIAEAHHGRIEVSSNNGSGATFTVTLPAGSPA
ncbi:MAG TPA: HAMP domain-containing sensor histidine kinase [Tepidiformaceae bacterium]|nr:HAMP domain-containing sensor histidine kinase [Tepidiformaceae bacterium]